MKNISRRDVKVFFLGMLTLFLIELAIDWEDAVEGFNAGYRGAQGKTITK